MRRASTHYTIGSMLWVAVSTAQAVGFGRVSNTTTLGQPLNFEAAVRLGTDETLAPECVSAEVFSGDNKLVQPLVRVQVDPGTDGAERKIRVRTTSVIDEPVVTVLLTLGCDNKTTRKFVAFIDPPAIGLAQSSAVGETQAMPATNELSPALAASGQRPAASDGSRAAAAQASARPSSSAPRAAARRSGNTAVAGAQPRRTKAPSFKTARAAPQAGPRLQLEAAPSVVTAKPPPAAPVAAAVAPPPPAPVAPPAVAAPASAVLVAEAPKATPDPAAPQAVSPEQARLKLLEESLTRVRDETQAAQKALLSLQTKVKEAEAQRYSNPLVYALAAVSALLALAVVMLWRRQSAARNEPKWWGTVAPAATPSRLPEPAEDNVPSQFAEEPELPKPAARIVTMPEPAKQVWADSRQTEPSPDLVPEPRRDLSVEELIDLEQQAEFFVVLGQDDAAIDLLMGHVRSTGGISPLPYLKLLEIYRRRGDRSAYERIRERFNRRFNAYAPDWDADLQQGRSLEDYPATIARLEALWVMPSRVMETLEASLFRRDETEEAFDLPAYRELLFLYAVARDFAHKADDSSAVDLLLPMDTDAPNAPVSRLVASMPSMLASRNPGAPGAPGGEASKLDGDSGSITLPGQASRDASKSDDGLSLDLGPLDLVDDPQKPGGIIRR